VAFVNNDHGAESVKIREMLDAIATGPQTIRIVDYSSLPRAVRDLKTGIVRGVVLVPYDFSYRVEHQDNPRLVFVEDNTDDFLSSALQSQFQLMVQQLDSPPVASRLPANVQLNIVEVYPYIQYIKYLLPGSIAMAIFVVAMIGGGITFIDDKSRGLHEGYLVTPIELRSSFWA